MRKIKKLDNINVEGLKKTGSHLDRSGSSRFNFKKVLVVAIIIGGLAVATVKSIPFFNAKYVVPDIPYSVVDTLEMNSSSTFLDEVLEVQANKSASAILNRIAELETYLNMSRKLEQLNLASYTDVVAEIEETTTFNKNLEEKYQSFLALVESTDKKVLSQNALDLYALAAELNGYKAVIDSKITSDGYDIIADYGILVAKTAVIDASGISYTNIDNLSIPYETEEYVINYTDPATGTEFKTKIPGSSIIHSVMDNVYRSQSADKESLTTSEIIADLTKYLNDIKVAIFMRYGNDGSLKTTNNYNDVRDLIEIPKTK